MKTIFAGPSICGATLERGEIDVRPPAEQGDVAAAVMDGANVIGLIDGAFEATASVWHKEILFALSEGVSVVGGASMGALRAAECAAFGMIAAGEIARRYLSGESDDDALVAVTHGPPELGSPPLTEALVDCEATIEAMRRRGAIDAAQARRVAAVARTMFYKDRTIGALAEHACPESAADFEAAYRRHRVSLKAADAMAVIAVVTSLADSRQTPAPAWTLSPTPLFAASLDAARRRSAPGHAG